MLSKFNKPLVAATVLCLMLGGPTEAASGATDATAVTRAAEEIFAQYYVDPEIGAAYRAKLAARAADGAFDGLTHQARADAMTKDLQAVNADGHLKIYAPGNGIFGVKGEDGEAQLPDNLIEASGWLAQGIAYIRPMMFLERTDDLKRISDFIDSHANANALIIDLRHHHGGELGEMNVLAADLYAKPTDLVVMRTRTAAWDRFEKTTDSPQLFVSHRDPSMVEQIHRAIPRRTGARLASIPVYVLTSKRTASAGEHFALALKRTKRAVLIGETTYGAGNYGAEVELAGGYSAFIPYGETVDQDSGKGWEATGVAPDVAVPAKDALNVALKALGAAPRAESYPSL